MQLRSIARRHGQTTFLVKVDGVNASKQKIPLLPLGSIFFHLFPLKWNIEIIRTQVKQDPSLFFSAMAQQKQPPTEAVIL
jgi:hypothetical protein